MSFLLDIPSDVMIEILSEWLKTKEIVRLDALCNHQYRVDYLGLFSKTILSDESLSYNKWLIRRKGKVRAFCLDNVSIQEYY